MSDISRLEVSVWDPTNPSNPTGKLAILESASSAQWTDLLADVGAGSCEISGYDPKVLSAAEGNLIKFSLGGVPVFGYFIDAPVLTSGEAADNKWALAGRSVLDYLSHALVYPAGGVSGLTVASPTRVFTAATYGAILKTLIDEAQARGSPIATIPALTYDFTATLDSVGASWVADRNLTINVGSTLLDVAKKLVSLGMGLYMDPQLVLHAYLPGTQGANLASTVVWRQGLHFRAPVTSTGNHSAMSTVCLVKGAGGTFVESSDVNWTGNPGVGRRESVLDYSSVSGDQTQMVNAGSQQIALSENSSQALTVALTHGGGGLYEPYVDYHLGDTVAIDVPGSYAAAPFKVVGLTIAQTAGANYIVEANLGSIALALDLQLKQLISSVSGSSSSLGGGAAGNLGLATPPQSPTHYVALGASYQDVVSSSTGVSIGQTHTPEITNAPVAGVVAVQAVVICNNSSGGGGTVYGLDYGGTVGVGVATGPVAAISDNHTCTLTTGGTNNRMVDYIVTRTAGTVTYIIRIVGYWTHTPQA